MKNLILIIMSFSLISCSSLPIISEPEQEIILKSKESVLTKLAKKYVGFIEPLKSLRGDNYCSSSAVQYRNKVYTITNQHCCEVDAGFMDGIVRVGDTLEKILYISPLHDICILSSKKSYSPIKLAKDDFGYLDEAYILGYPRGEEYTPRQGNVLALNEFTPVNYGWGDVRSRPSHVISFITFGGNSGSPVFNYKGELVNLLYAGPDPVNHYGVTVPLYFIRKALETIK